MNLCINCKHMTRGQAAQNQYQYDPTVRCSHPSAVRQSPVDGSIQRPSCAVERSTGDCGMEGKNYETNPNPQVPGTILPNWMPR